MRAFLVALVATLPALSTAVPVSPALAVPADTYERQAVQVTNRLRTQHDLRRLRTDSCLGRFADRHASRMAREQRVFHQDLSPILRRCHLTGVGENVAHGYSNGRTVVSRGWMRSPGHRANVLTGRFRIVAVGSARSDTGSWYTAQVLGRR